MHVPTSPLELLQKAIYLFQKTSYSPCGTFLFRTKAIFALNACAEQQALVSTTYQVEDTFHTRSDANVECLSLRYNPNKSYACVLTRLAQCKNSAMTAMTARLLELRPIGFKKYHLLFPNYTSAFISSFSCLYQRDQNGHTSSRNFPE